ncbi:hypothetical protein ACB098_06G079400 [Castanea mollissima]
MGKKWACSWWESVLVVVRADFGLGPGKLESVSVWEWSGLGKHSRIEHLLWREDCL